MNSKDRKDDYGVSCLFFIFHFHQDEAKDFLFSAGDSRRKPVEWPTTGGMRLNQSRSPQVSVNSIKAEDDDYNEADSLTVAVKLGGASRITRRFNPRSPINDVFSWVEKNIKTSDVVFYTLLQMAPNRRFVKDPNGCIEIVENNEVSANGLFSICDRPQRI